MKRFIKMSMLFTLLFAFPFSTSGQEQTPPLTMEELSIQVMPEYSYHPHDKSKSKSPLLIGYHGTLMNKSEQPLKGKIEIPLPIKQKGFQIGFVADYNRDQSQMYEIEYELNKETGTISWTTSEEVQPGELYKFVIEFYTNEITENNSVKSLSYSFKSFADIGIVRILFLEPLKAENFRLTPAADSHQENGYGMNMFMYQIQGMKANETKDIQLEYKRSESKTTIDLMNEMGANSEGKGEEKKNETLSMGVIVGGISSLTALIMAGMVFILKRKAQKVAPFAANASEYVRINSADYEAKKKQLRAMLVAGKITEAEYNELLEKLLC